MLSYWAAEHPTHPTPYRLKTWIVSGNCRTTSSMVMSLVIRIGPLLSRWNVAGHAASGTSRRHSWRRIGASPGSVKQPGQPFNSAGRRDPGGAQEVPDGVPDEQVAVRHAGKLVQIESDADDAAGAYTHLGDQGIGIGAATAAPDTRGAARRRTAASRLQDLRGVAARVHVIEVPDGDEGDACHDRVAGLDGYRGPERGEAPITRRAD